MFDTIRLTDIFDLSMVQIIPIAFLDEGRVCRALFHFMQGAANDRNAPKVTDAPKESMIWVQTHGRHNPAKPR